MEDVFGGRRPIWPSRIAVIFNCFVIIFASYGYLYIGLEDCQMSAVEMHLRLRYSCLLGDLRQVACRKSNQREENKGFNVHNI